MCNVNCQSNWSKMSIIQTCSSCTGWINMSSSCFSAEPHTSCGLDLAPDSWSQHTPILRYSWTVSPPPPPSAHKDHPQMLAPWQLVLVPMTCVPREPGKTVSAPSPWSSAPAGEAGASPSPLVPPTRCRLATAPHLYSHCVDHKVRFLWQPTSRWIRPPSPRAQTTPACWSSASRCNTRRRSSTRLRPSTFGRSRNRHWWRGECLGSGHSVAQRSAVGRARDWLGRQSGNLTGRWWRSPRCAGRLPPSAPHRSSRMTGPGGLGRRLGHHTPVCRPHIPPPTSAASQRKLAGSAGYYPWCSAAGGSIWPPSPSWMNPQQLQVSHRQHSYLYLQREKETEWGVLLLLRFK